MAIIYDFESGDLNRFDKEQYISYASAVEDSDAPGGSWVVEQTNQFSSTFAYDSSTTNRTPPYTVTGWVTGGGNGGVCYAADLSRDPDETYVACYAIRLSNGSFEIIHHDTHNARETIAETTVNTSSGNYYYMECEFTDTGEHNATIYDSSMNQMGSTSVTDTRFTDGWTGFYASSVDGIDNIGVETSGGSAPAAPSNLQLSEQ